MSRVEDALLLRDLVQKIVNDKLGKDRPSSSYATVTGFSPALGTVTVIYDGDTVEVEIPAGSIYPSEIGQVVKIGGPSGSKVVEDVMGENLTEVKVREAQASADGKNTIHYGETAPEGTDHKEGDTWFDESNSNMPHIWDGSDWKSIADLRVSAIKEAQDQLREDLDEIVVGTGGTQTFYKPTQPAIADSKEGDLWFDTSSSGNNELHTFVGGAWVSAADARISVISAAQESLREDLDDVIENGSGTKTHYSTTRPIDAISKEGDLWFDPSDNNRPYIYQDGDWITVRDSYTKPADDPLGNLAPVSLTSINEHALANQSFTKPWQEIKRTDLEIAPGQNVTLMTMELPEVVDDTSRTELAFQSTFTSSGEQEADGTELSITANRVRMRTQFAVWGAGPFDIAGYKSHRIAAFDKDGNYIQDVTSYTDQRKVIVQAAAIPEDYSDPDVLWNSGYYALLVGADWSVTHDFYYAVPADTIPGVASIAIIVATPPPRQGMTRIALLQSDSRVQMSSNGIDANAVTETKISDNAISTPKLQAKVITTDKLAVGAITAESGVVGSLNAGDITVGTLSTARLAANSVTADKVLIGSERNLIPNGDLSAGSSVGWPSAATYQTTDKPAELTAAVTFPAGASYNYDFKNMGTWSVRPGEVVVFETWVKADKPNSMLFFTLQDQTGPNTSTAGRILNWTSIEGGAGGGQGPISTMAVPTVWTKVVSKTTIPAGVTSIVPQAAYLNHTSGTERDAAVSFSGLKLYKQVGATLIEDGAITTDKIAVGAITAASGIIASLDAGKITVGTLAAARFAANTINADSILVNGSLGSTIIKDGAITTAKLAVGSITAESGVIGSLDASKITVGTLSGARLAADAINGKQIVGAQIITSLTFPRVQLDEAGLAVYKSSSVRSFFADAATGNLSIIGDFSTGTDGNERVNLSNALWSSIEVIDETGAFIGNSAGSGIRVGKSSAGSLEMYHAGRTYSSGYVEGATIAGPRYGTPGDITTGALLDLSKTTKTTTGEIFSWGKLSARTSAGAMVAELTASAFNGGFAAVNSNGYVDLSSNNDIAYVRAGTDVNITARRGIVMEGGVGGTATSAAVTMRSNNKTVLDIEYIGPTDGSGRTISVDMRGAGKSAGSWGFMPQPTGYSGARISFGGNYSSPYGKFAGAPVGLLLRSGTGPEIDLDPANNEIRFESGSGVAPVIKGLPIATGDGIDFVGTVASGGSLTKTVNFPTGKFSSPPSVSAMTSNGKILPVVFNITKSSFSFRVWNISTGNTSGIVGTWMAVMAS